MFLKTGLRTILCVAAPETKSDFSPAKSDFGLQVRRTEKVLLVTFVTIDKSNPKRSGRTETISTVYQQSNNVQVKIYAVVAVEVSGRLRAPPVRI